MEGLQFPIGIGKLISWDSIILCPQKATCLTEENPFFPISAREMNRTTVQHGRIDEDSDSFECPHPQCSEEFHSRLELDNHLTVIAHDSSVEIVQRSLYDQMRINWVQRFQSISLNAERQSRLDSEVEIATSTEDSLLQMGWALHKSRSGKSCFSDKVREYLQKKFELGQETGRKEDPAQVASDMRKARNTDGTRMFSRAEWLSKIQIQGFFLSNFC